MKEIDKRKAKEERRRLRYKVYHLALIEGGLATSLKGNCSPAKRTKVEAIRAGIIISREDSKQALSRLNKALKYKPVQLELF